MRVAHIVNPVDAEPSSDLRVAQPVTFESMRVAAEYAAPSIQVDLISAQFAQDRATVPSFITLTRDLDRSASDVGTFSVPRRLPLLGDILERLDEASPRADLYVYTNVDIGLVPHFYVSIATLVQDSDALIVNRRTIPAHLNTVDRLPLMYAEVGKRHPGLDCFVFRAGLLGKFELGRSLIGAPWVGNAMLCNLACHARSFALFKDLHLTFHIGNDRAWRRPALDDYRAHNRRELLGILDGWNRLGLVDGNTILRDTLLRAARAERRGTVRKARPLDRLRRAVQRLTGLVRRR